jgi:photosystem II stability/assembly factor-like uncharacterized protein
MKSGVKQLSFALMLAIAFSNCLFSQNGKITAEKYIWKNVAIGGGGYVTGIVAHPAEKDLIYIRTDVGGAYRWDEAGKCWIPLTNFLGMDEWNLYGIESIALDPSDPDVVYMAAGKYDKNSIKDRAYSAFSWKEGQPEPSDILKSTDRGKTWHRTGLNVDNMANRGNYRNAGERLMVDPNYPKVVYFGSRNDGLWKSEDKASPGSWKQVNSFTGKGKAGAGISFLLFDTKSGSPGTPTKIIYAGLPGSGVMISHDAGVTWQLIKESPINPMRALIHPSGELWITHSEGVANFSKGVWTDRTPVGNKAMYCAIGFHPQKPDIMLAGIRKGLESPMYISRDGGKSWSLLQNKRKANVPWWPEKYWTAATSAILFDPIVSDRVWYTDWYGTWRTEDITADTSQWVTYENGHEEMCVFNVVSSPKGGNLFTCIADNDGNRHTRLDAYPERSYNDPDLQETTSIDFCESNPDAMARVGSWDWGKRGGGGYSSNNGINWTPFESIPPDARHGRIACSATNPHLFIWLPEKSKPYLTKDRGVTWTEIPELPDSGVLRFWAYNQPLASDRVDGATFYFYQGGDFYVSQSSGKNWQKTASLPYQTEWHRVKAAPGIKNEVWVSLGTDGMYRSVDAGKTFSKIFNIQEAFLFGFGKNAPGVNNPVVFLLGKIGNESGIFRSNNMGKTWVKIDDKENRMGNEPHCLEGDRQVYGRIYLGTGGSGIFYGETE